MAKYHRYYTLGVLAYVVFVAAFAEAVIEHNKQTAKALDIIFFIILFPPMNMYFYDAIFTRPP